MTWASREKMSSPRVFFVIPAFNEAGRVGRVLRELREHGYRDLVVVDDGSADGTASRARRAGAVVVRHRRNRGQGAALRSGIREALRRGADVIVTFDADGQHLAREAGRLVGPVVRGEADVVFGSRFLGAAPGIPFVKRLVLRGGVLVERLLLGARLSDAHNGFRAFSRRAAELVEISCDGMAHASEIVYEVRERGLRYREVPVTIRYDAYSRARGQSVLNAFRILVEILRLKRWKAARWRRHRRRR